MKGVNVKSKRRSAGDAGQGVADGGRGRIGFNRILDGVPGCVGVLEAVAGDRQHDFGSGRKLAHWLERGHASAAVIRPDGAVMYAGRDVPDVCCHVPGFASRLADA